MTHEDERGERRLATYLLVVTVSVIVIAVCCQGLNPLWA